MVKETPVLHEHDPRIDNIVVRYFFEGLQRINDKLWPNERVSYLREKARGTVVGDNGAAEAEEDEKETRQLKQGHLDERAFQSLWLDTRGVDGQRVMIKIGVIDPKALSSSSEMEHIIKRLITQARTKQKQEQLREVMVKKQP